MLENFLSGVTKRLKVDYETLKIVNPKIIYASVTSYGDMGPYQYFPGYDAVIYLIFFFKIKL